MKVGKIILLAAVLLNSVVGQSRFSIDDYTKMDVDQRRNLFGENKMKIDDPGKFLDLFILGLEDPDSIVRRNATGRLSFVMIGLQKLKREKGSIPVDMSRVGEVQDLLIVSSLSSSDAQTRGAAIQALAYSAEPNARIESALLSQLAQEQNDQLKAGIIETMGFAGYNSNAYVLALRESILVPSDHVRDAAMKSVAAIKPPGMLPLIAQALENRTNLHWGVKAMAAYGAQAQPYLPLLRELAAEPTLNLGDRIREAIATITNPPLQAAPQIKTVPLIGASSRPPSPTSSPQATPVPVHRQASSTPKGGAEKWPALGVPSVPSVLAAIFAAVVVSIIVFLLRRRH